MAELAFLISAPSENYAVHVGFADSSDVFGENLRVTAEMDVPLSRFALAWLSGRPGVTCPIVGPRTMAHLEDNLAALAIEVPEAALRSIDAWIPSGSIA